MDKGEFYSVVDKDTVINLTRVVPTPCYVYFKRLLHKRCADVRGCLPGSFEVHYAIKANPNRILLRELASLGVGADVASLGELTGALECGMKPSTIEFSGPGKSEGEIIEGVRQGIASINAESLSELERIVRASRQLAIKARVGLRINPGSIGHHAGMAMSGDTQFGIPLTSVADALGFVRANADSIVFTGIHLHSGSQILSSDALLRNFGTILDISLDIANLAILPLSKINFGGGWGITYFPNHSGLNLRQLADGLKGLFDDAKYSRLLRCRHIVEPGRFLVGECGLYLTSVVDRKPGVRRQFLIVDGGMHHHYLLAGGMGQVIRRNFEIDVIESSSQATATAAAYDIAGCLCTPQDILASDFRSAREVHEGDRIVFFNSGAYGLTASPINFLSHRPPSEVVV